MKTLYKIKMKSGWRVGSGFSGGALCDSLLARDKNYQPFVSGTMLAGLLRDYAGQLFDMLPHYKATRNRWLDLIFGSPSRAKLVNVSMAKMTEKASANKGKKILANVVRRNSIDPKLRRNDESKLFALEEMDSDVEMEFSLESPDEKIASFLCAVARLIRNLGASRRRGLGECIIKCLSEQQRLLQVFKECWLDQENDIEAYLRNLRPQYNICISEKALSKEENAVYKVRMILRTDEPLLLSDGALKGNNFSGRKNIRGAAVWGLLASKCMGKRAALSYESFNSIFFQGGIKVSDFYLVKTNKQVPLDKIIDIAVPLSFDVSACKTKNPLDEKYAQEKHKLVSAYADDYNFKGVCDDCSSKMQNVTGMVGITDVLLREPIMRFDMHNKMMEGGNDYRSGKVVEEGGLYSYYTLEAEQFFVGEITCASEQLWQEICEQANVSTEQDKVFSLHLGRARQRGHGKVSAFWQVVDDDDSNKDIFYGRSIGDRIKREARVLYMQLLSDMILQDEWGRFACGLDAGEVLKKELVRQGFSDSQIKIGRTFGRSKDLAGFNAYFGLPRTESVSVTAGSIIAIELLDDDTNINEVRETCKTIEIQGIGLRTAEGFGRVAFNHTMREMFLKIRNLNKCRIKIDLKDLSVGVSGSDKKIVYVKKQEKAWRKDIENMLAQEIAQGNEFKINKGVATQWAHLARFVRNHQNEGVKKLLQVMKGLYDEVGGAESSAFIRSWHDSKEINGLSGNDEIDLLCRKTHFFADENKGKKGLEKIKSILEKVDNENRDEKYQKVFIEVFSDYIAQIAFTMAKGGAK